MTIAISTTDPRSLKALALASTAGQWLKFRGHDSHKRCGVPSQSTPGLSYLVDTRSCTCPDWQQRQQPCKHLAAVRLHVAQVRAQAA